MKKYCVPEEENYFDLKEIPGQGLCGLHRMAFTVGLFVGLTEINYRGRYCYHNLADAKEALREWDCTGDAPGEWVKYKAEGIDRRRVPDPFEKI